ncbi:hypothetical protein SAMD00079811_56730 [Scytonema sp. HK-05]|uniref:DUF4112 domain-containing protein n=1 Tax=Scytonema sp. HK-05 TaxID=1137095 RepID=UPI000937F822|nr:DUF4112 domain-containing protein [Scytonema sp. HK-05]OKH57774.1 hypothetical protein NIES2130_18080 [Scytonema sp. HK-05]BAY48054.1 hypothetical protein SAMD00079811_56730 [Scytonema sp. HK-05]
MSEFPPHYPTMELDAKAPTLRRLRQLSRLLDRVITVPGTQISIGLDPILGLIPVGGDFLGVMLSAYIVLESARLGAPASTLSRMVVNIIIDAVVGAIPIAGDLFDVGWKANEYNIKLLEDHLKSPSQRKRADKWFVFAIMTVLFIVAIGLVAFAVILMKLLGTLLGTLLGVLTGG